MATEKKDRMVVHRHPIFDDEDALLGRGSLGGGSVGGGGGSPARPPVEPPAASDVVRDLSSEEWELATLLATRMVRRRALTAPEAHLDAIRTRLAAATARDHG